MSEPCSLTTVGRRQGAPQRHRRDAVGIGPRPEQHVEPAPAATDAPDTAPRRTARPTARGRTGAGTACAGVPPRARRCDRGAAPSPSRPAADQRENRRAPGNQGIGASTSTSQRRPSAAICCRLNGADSGSAAFGKILVITSTRMAGGRVRMQHPPANFNRHGAHLDPDVRRPAGWGIIRRDDVRAGRGRVAALCCATAAVARARAAPAHRAVGGGAGDAQGQLASSVARRAAVRACRKSLPRRHAERLPGRQWAFPASACGLAYQLTGDRPPRPRGPAVARAARGRRARSATARRAWRAPRATAIAAIGATPATRSGSSAPHAALAYDWLHDAPGVDEALRASRAPASAPGSTGTRPTATCTAAGRELPRGLRRRQDADRDRGAARADGAGAASSARWSTTCSGATSSATAWRRQRRVRTSRHGALIGGDWPEGWQYGPLSVVEYAFAARALGEQGVRCPRLAAWSDDITLRFLHGLTPERDGCTSAATPAMTSRSPTSAARAARDAARAEQRARRGLGGAPARQPGRRGIGAARVRRARGRARSRRSIRSRDARRLVPRAGTRNLYARSAGSRRRSGRCSRRRRGWSPTTSMSTMVLLLDGCVLPE